MSGVGPGAASPGAGSGPWRLPPAVTIRDVGPRDGLQVEQPLPPETRVALTRALAAAGLREIEVAAFVSPRAVPAMAGAAELIAELGSLPGVVRTALVPNERGARDALAAGVDALTVTVSASERYSLRNTRMGRAQALAGLAPICAAAAARGDGVPVDVVISCAFGSPYEGEIAHAEVELCRDAAVAAGAARVTLADTTGMATPPRVAALVQRLGGEIGVHFHETRGTGLLNAWAAVACGVTRLDSSLGGLGGSPFASGAAGNVATEELVLVLEDAGVATGIDLDRLLRASALLAQAVGRELPSAVARSGPRLPPAR
ncbi:hydroxymethylglutaryl-CoA lyase [Conexibacter sp. JD483]|uniref:hydroxymethylglutaryl-CoA lyase n=1 Tax=unclassified Conexibacter TaxID=2627773 RepID=UPI002716891A|nr:MULTISPECIES: hydroxymethylglutaryl-CoA lyase [unclassified Conexibacter]MDO8187773.1 hydroxymethylglutaryl-CoA lyase [Conexibacter sp. CPCC 205706]MDO8201382.1 hydroxymethylglutaryl-CoA lyase [Conexibacter sp. CPCC 205762]MDR9373025.1 hydroxymethylglutaryl-CoA lyase [Conexibacter sp. JD483]